MVTARRLCLLLAALLPFAADAQVATNSSPCTIVFGQGRNPAAGDDEANARWDEANRALASQVALDIAERDIRTVLVLAPVAVTDVALIVDTLTDNARREGCDRIVETNLFAESDELLVVRLREYPVHVERTPPRIGEAAYVSRQEYPNTQRNRDRLVPARLGKVFASEYLAQRIPTVPGEARLPGTVSRPGTPGPAGSQAGN